MRPITPAKLRAELADRIEGLPGRGRHIVLVDGMPTAEPEGFADDLVDPLRELGLPVQRIDTRDFLRPASLRLEQGKRDPDAYYEQWLDLAGLRREVLDRWRADGACSVLPTLRDPVQDRATRAGYVEQAEGAVLLLAGNLLLHNGIHADLAVHLGLRDATVRRRLSTEDEWILPALRRYRAELAPEETADVLVRFDHPDRPAVGFGS